MTAKGEDFPWTLQQQFVVGGYIKDKNAVYYVMDCPSSCPTQLLPIEGADPATFYLLPRPVRPQSLDYLPSTPESYLFAADKDAVYNYTSYTTSMRIERIPLQGENLSLLHSANLR
jgi:hypothetical protein